MADLSIGFAAFVMESPNTGKAPSWNDVRAWARLAEEASFDTFWIPDELVWENAETGTTSGWWECVAVTGAVAATTSTIDVGTWVLSALHRNPGLTVKAAEAIDEISGGRFIFGLGAGHAARQGEMFGFPPDRTVSRYEDALNVIIPLLREGSADHQGEYHSAVRQPNRPRGPQKGDMRLMLAGHGPRNIGLAVRYADIWSAYATTSSQPEAFDEMLASVDRICDEQGRDPQSLGKSIGIGAAAPDRPPGPFWDDSEPVVGTAEEIAGTLLAYHRRGVTSIELCIDDDPEVAIPLLAEVVEMVKKA